MAKRIYIKAEVTEEEREELRKIAEEKKTTVSALILNSIKIINRIEILNYLKT